MEKAMHIYESELTALSKLSDRQLGRLLRAFLMYLNGMDVDLCDELKIPFDLIKGRHQREDAERTAVSQKNRANVNSRWNRKDGRTGEPGDLEGGNDGADGDGAGTADKSSSDVYGVIRRNTAYEAENEKKENFPSDSPIKEEKLEKKENISKEIQKKEPSQAYLNFRVWMQENTPTMFKGIGSKLSEPEFVKLRGAVDGERLALYAMQIENNREYLKKYRSLYLTLLNWIKRDGG